MTIDLKAFCLKLYAEHEPFGHAYEFARNKLARRESQLEELFLVLWVYWHTKSGGTAAVTYAGEPFPWAPPMGEGRAVKIDLCSQVKIGRDRLDFLARIAYPGGKAVRFALECDGHSFHDRTPAQASADRARDRRMLREGIVTIRFTYKDLTGDTWKSVQDLWNTMKAFTLASQPDAKG